MRNTARPWPEPRRRGHRAHQQTAPRGERQKREKVKASREKTCTRTERGKRENNREDEPGRGGVAPSSEEDKPTGHVPVLRSGEEAQQESRRGRRACPRAQRGEAGRRGPRGRRPRRGHRSPLWDGLAHAGGRAGGGLDPDPSLHRPRPSLRLRGPSLSLLLLSVPLLLTGGRWEGRGGEAPHSEAPPRLPPGSEPAPYLVVLHVSVGPVFQQQEGRLHVIDSGCPVKGGFSCTGNSRVSRRENGVACSRCEQASSLAQGSLALPGARQEAGSPWGPVGRT